jgi:NADPH:quinone reductase-like Zn-dependent oxidoreductase
MAGAGVGVRVKAAVYRRYGPPDVVEIADVAPPVPGDDDVLIEVRAASVNPADWHFMRGEPALVRLVAGLRTPRNPRLGRDVAGRVQVVGHNVIRFRPADEVFGTCAGSFAQFALAREAAIAAKPSSVAFEQAAAVPIAALTALQGLRDHGRVRRGHAVLVNGAAGGVGTFAVQIAKSYGARVTGVCSTANVGMVRSIGADEVVDYTKEDFAVRRGQYDVFFDCVVNHTLAACLGVLTPDGVHVIAGAARDQSFLAVMARPASARLRSPVGGRRVRTFIAKPSHRDLAVVGDLMAAGAVRAVIDRRYKLSDTADAIRYLEGGHARGKVIVEVS